MSQKTNELTKKQEAAIMALVTEPTIAAAAQKAGVDSRTLHRWKAEEAFAQALRVARSAVMEGANMQLRNASGKAVSTLERLLDSPREDVACRAAVAILSNAYKAVEVEDITHRLDDIERRMEEKPL